VTNCETQKTEIFVLQGDYLVPLIQYLKEGATLDLISKHNVADAVNILANF